jgi:predicted HD superfamily hydrolase involved in NAD metabolism
VELKTYNEITGRLATGLDTDRYVHSLGAAFTAAALAMRYNADVDKALLAGLLHDCAKCFSAEECYVLCEEAGIELSPLERRNSSLIHAKLGTYIAARDYGVDDPEILDAIRTHTTGCPGMTDLQKIVFIADIIEPNREDIIPSIDQMRAEAFKNLDNAVFLICDRQLAHLANFPHSEVDPETKRTYEYYKELLNEN